MTNVTLMRGISIGLVSGFVVLVILLLAREHRQVEKLETTRRDVCQDQRYRLEAVIKGDAGQGDLHTRVKFDFANITISKMCLGTEIPVSFMEADTCWIEIGDAARCYVPPLDQLLTLYKQRVN